jgi:cob(I)alamin adenosyltransferase
MLYTRKGDKGTTKTYGCDQRISKSSATAEALGSMDGINSLLGIVKVKAKGKKFKKQKISEIVHNIQETLFIIQAEIAGFNKTLSENKVKEIEIIIDGIEKELPPIKTFFISGGTELGALFDYSRTVARRAERRAVAVHEENIVKIGKDSLAYLNRLSSLLYALARLSNQLSGINEVSPKYK